MRMAADILAEIDDETLPSSALALAPGAIYGGDRIDGADAVIVADNPAAVDALVAAGCGNTVCVVAGAGQGAVKAISKAADFFEKFARIVVAVRDQAVQEEVARRLGRHRCWLTTWPAGSDAATLAGAGRLPEVRRAIDEAAPAPIAGVFKAGAATMTAYRHSPEPAVLGCGCDAFDSKAGFPSEGKIIVVTGVPNMGKSTFITHVMAHLAHNNERKWLIFSPEFGDWRALAAQVLVWRAGKPLRGKHHVQGMTDQEIREHAAWCERHFSFLSCDSEDETPTLDWILERASAIIAREGLTDILIDPWNELHHPQNTEAETIYLNRCLQRLRAFTLRHGVNFWLVSHPTKLRPVKPGDPIPCPNIYDVNGGAAWANKSDMILAVHRSNDETEIHVLKSRFRRWGQRGFIARLTLNPITGRFRSAYLDPMDAREK